jgi:hypothetical protein
MNLPRYRVFESKTLSMPVFSTSWQFLAEEELLDQYLKVTGLEKEPDSPLFPAAIGKTGKLSRRPLVHTDAADMLKRRLKQAGYRPIIRLIHSGRPASRFFGK